MPASRRSTVRVWVAAVLSLLAQLATTAWALQLAGPSMRGHPGFATAYYAGSTPFAMFERTHPAPGWMAGIAFACAVAGPVILVALHRRPRVMAAGAATIAVAGTVLFATQDLAAPFYLSAIFAVAGASFQRARVWAWSCAGAYWLTFALSALASDIAQLPWLVPLTLISLGALLGPEFGRNRQEARARLLRDLEARQAEEAQAERVRIARELHDVLAHSLSQINVQASVGLHLFDAQPEKAAEALANVKETSKQALGEVRQVLGLLRGDEAPLAPEQGLEGIRRLVEEARGVDAALHFEVADAAAVPAAVQQAAYRIVQEALTNVTRHSQARRVDVAVTSTGARLRVVVSDDGHGGTASAYSAGSPPERPRKPATAVDGHGGRGLLGMRERAELLGGTFSAGPRAGGGFEVVAELPWVASA